MKPSVIIMTNPQCHTNNKRKYRLSATTRHQIQQQPIHILKRISLAVAIMTSIGLQQKAYAMPFSPDPISFASYLNSYRNWYDRSLRVRFENLGNCEFSYNENGEAYACKVGYAKISDSISSRLCRVNVFFNLNGEKEIGYKEYDCRVQDTRETGGTLYRRAKEWLKNF
jgi:hypothetical protein